MLTHPFGVARKKRMLRRLSVSDTPPTCLLALFPELAIAGEQAGTVQPLSAETAEWGLTGGDRSERWITEAQTVLTQLGVWEDDERTDDRAGRTERMTQFETVVRAEAGTLAEAGSVPPLFLLEEWTEQQRAAAFLAKHYYRYAMFPWFWKMYERVEDTNYFLLHGMAMDIACFDPKAPRKLEAYFADYLLRIQTDEARQRLWNKLGVLYIFRHQFALAERSLDRAWAMLKAIDGQERVCREAEWFNAVAFFWIRQGDFAMADDALTRAELRLGECTTQNDPRVAQIGRILQGNREQLVFKALVLNDSTTYKEKNIEK
ncbi:MAG TPA: hypothetical protein VFV52_11075 [Bacilli bacterium]|nr:hypothetical protein [Bacilli bacterium]